MAAGADQWDWSPGRHGIRISWNRLHHCFPSWLPSSGLHPLLCAAIVWVHEHEVVNTKWATQTCCPIRRVWEQQEAAIQESQAPRDHAGVIKGGRGKRTQRCNSKEKQVSRHLLGWPCSPGLLTFMYVTLYVQRSPKDRQMFSWLESELLRRYTLLSLFSSKTCMKPQVYRYIK